MARGKASGQSAQTQLRVGRLTKAHGLKGALKLELFTDDPDKRFAPGAEFSLQVPTSSPWHGKRISLTELRWYNGHPVGFFDGVADRTAAESLVKAILWVEQPADEPGEEDAWYDHQLVGLTVVRDGVPVGTISRLEHFPAQDLLVVKTADGEVLVPFVKAIVPTVDIEARTVTVTPPAGLFEELVDEDPEPEASEPSEPFDEVEASEVEAPLDADADGPEPGSAEAAGPSSDDAVSGDSAASSRD